MLVKLGSLIHEEVPFVFVLSSNLRKKHCDHCFEQCEVKTCSGCHFVGYCGRICQRAGWTAHHRAECPRLAALSPDRILPNAARLLARIIVKLKRGGENDKGWYANKSRFRCFSNLMSHYTSIKDDVKRMEHVICLRGVLSQFFKDDESMMPTMAEFTALYGRVVINSFNMLNSDLNDIGTGIYLGASTIDHSCQPNCVATFSGTTIKIRAIADIHEFTWDKASISYIEVMKIRSERRKELEERYYFTCGCSRCCDSVAADSEIAMSCSACSKDVPFRLFENICGGVKCCNCDKDIPDNKVTDFKEAILFTKLQIESMKDIAFFDACEVCLRKLSSAGASDGTLLYGTILDLGMEAALRLELWSEAERYGKLLVPKLEAVAGQYHPLLALLNLRLARLCLLRENGGREIEEARKYVNEAERVLHVTHGIDHPVYRENLLPLARQVAGDL